MRYVGFDAPGDSDVLCVAECERPEPRAGEVLVRVEAAGVSHADVMQRRGNYPPPAGASPILGLDVAGTVESTGDGVTRWRRGDRVCALLTGGGYAEFAAAPAGQVLPMPDGWTPVEAATLPENGFTVYDNLVTRARLDTGDAVLVHGGTSGIGSTAIMFARALGARVIATAGGAEKCDACLQFGAEAAVNYRTEDFVERTLVFTKGRGVDIVVDIVGGDYIARDVRALALDGRIACVAAQGGTRIELDLAQLFAKRATVFGSSLRPRTVEQKKAIADSLRERIWPLLPAKDVIRPIVDRVYPFDQAAEAHRRMESSQHIGKIVLVP